MIMPINASYEFINAEKEYLKAKDLEEKITCLEDMIRKAPGHKGAENLRAELRVRLKKFKDKLEKGKKSGKGRKGIKKEGYQVALVGFTNSGKSSLLGKMTNAKPIFSSVEFTTKEADIGTMNYEGVKAQIVDLPSFKSKNFDHNVVNGADCLLIVVDNFEDIKKADEFLERTRGKRIVVVNKIDLLSANEKRKLDAKCKAKRLKNFVLVSANSEEGVVDLKKRIFEGMKVIRIYTKEPGKEKTRDPIVLPDGSNVKDVAENIYKGFSRQIKETRLTGPSAKFSNQKVGLKHKLKDKDVIEFHSK